MGQAQALDEIDKDIENVRAAWEWAARHGRADLLIEAAACLGHFFEWQGRVEEGATAFIQAQAALEGDPAAMHARVQSMAWLAAFLRLLGQSETARLQLDDVDTLLARLSDRDVSSSALGAFVALQRGHLELYNRGDFQAVHTAYTHSLQEARAAGDQWLEAQALHGLGNAYQHLTSDYAEAAVCYEASLALQRRCGDQLGLIRTLADLSLNLRYRGLVFEGLLPAQESYDFACRIDNPMQRAYAASNLGYAYFWVGRHDRAIPLLEDVVRIFTEIGGQELRSNALIRLGSVLGDDGRYAEAFELIETGLRISREINYTVNEHLALATLLSAALGAGDHERERRYRAEALTTMRERGAHFYLVQVLVIGASAERKSGNRAEARRMALSAVHLAVTYRIWLGLTWGLLCLAFLMADEGEVERAIELISLFQRERPWQPSPRERDVFEQDLDALLASLPPGRVAAARERGQRRDLWTTGQELLDELEAAGWAEG